MNLFKMSIVVLSLVLGSATHAETTEQKDDSLSIVVYRSPTCGCCSKWVEHLRDNQFKIEDVVLDDMQAVKEKYRVPREMQSCHTALIGGYVVEGHVPAEDIKRLLKIKPKVIGISVPGMPVGTPGMEMGNRKAPYDVISFDDEGGFKVFSSHGQ